jgi:hypothetical protein
MPRVAKDSLTGKAMTYLHNQWDKLNVYCTDGQLRMTRSFFQANYSAEYTKPT